MLEKLQIYNDNETRSWYFKAVIGWIGSYSVLGKGQTKSINLTYRSLIILQASVGYQTAVNAVRGRLLTSRPPKPFSKDNLNHGHD